MKDFRILPFIFAVLVKLNGFANGADYPIPEAGISISLPAPWLAMDASIVKSYNEDMLRLRPQTRARYIAGFTRGKVPAGQVIGTDYIWIQRTPGAIMPNQLIALLPKTFDKNKKEFVEILKETIQDVGIGTPYFDGKIGAVVLPMFGDRTDGQRILTTAYLLPMRNALVSVSAQAAPGAAKILFTEAHAAMSAIIKQEDAKPTKEWSETFKQLLDQK